MGASKHVNVDYLDTLAEGNNEFILDLINMFISQVPKFSEQLDRHLKDADFFAMGKLSHKIKGSVSSLGIKALVKNMQELESLAKKNVHSNKYAELVHNYKKISAEVIDELSIVIHRYKIEEP